MKLTLLHQTTQAGAIQKIDDKLNELIGRNFSGLTVVDPQKSWQDNFMRFSFTVEKLFLTIDFSGTVIVTDQEVIGESDLPGIVTTFFSEERIKEEIKKEFNKLFAIT
ncbi:MAG: hypothetical protein WC768_01570 [Patescibacteria group bacterium]